ncbi:TPA: hypothetical protein SK286_001299 [Yersinia enterocolitica]|uniref:Uncharacterized protein n=1 Tax=Yersinia aldovae TaxID=29483 RepID=A0ABM9SRJ2_YERAL|nr:ABC-three component system middle component 7 [Yersinia aldovae]EKN3967314.1 hypothetical protein [Yersinia enterocolitica]CNJ23635.1 Uncharacterised protein [Yersinia aldovae]CNK85928.1 Uncharacterised protein [Yersinia aldovae]HDL7950259.1 hypothetical protein [Yersinia enterocolitica]HEI6905444.1 hypothetical protein [Yersinia enterocolitica]
MLIPNKTISLDESTLYKAAQLLHLLKNNIDLIVLYSLVNKEFTEVTEFIDTLDLLFVLDKIKLNHNSGEIEIA